VLDEVEAGVTRLLVRARGGPDYSHFVMQRKQLLGIKRRAESESPGTFVPADWLPTAREHAA
jgi:hypothetical protein